MTPRANIVITKVSELIDADNRVWDAQLIHELFWPIDAQRILNIPLAVGMMEDFVSWHLHRSGSFTVNSAYHEEWEHQHGRKLRMTNSIQASSTSPVWRTVWKLNVPSKVKIHVWKTLLGAIPCQGVLANRHIITSSQCPLCNSDCESIRHALFLCPRVQQVWRLLGLASVVNEVCMMEREGGSVMADLLMSKNPTKALVCDVQRNDLVTTAVWYLWWERHSFTHGEQLYEPTRSAQAISALAKNFSRANSKKGRIKRHGWEKPLEGMLKLNFDAGFDSDSGTGATGAILRDHTGFFVAASCSNIPFVQDAATAEARGLRDGLLLANEMGCNKICVEGDCMEDIEIMQNGGNHLVRQRQFMKNAHF